MDIPGDGWNSKAVVYYRDFNLKELKYGKVIKSGLGTLKKYEPTPLRIQFPKLKAVDLTDSVISYEIPKGSKGFNFFQELETINKSRGPQPLGNRKLFNAIDCDDSESRNIIEMKVNRDTLYFREDNYQISRSDIVDCLDSVKIICIANSPGLWTTDKSYGNTWNVEQIKVFTNKTR